MLKKFPQPNWNLKTNNIVYLPLSRSDTATLHSSPQLKPAIPSSGSSAFHAVTPPSVPGPRQEQQLQQLTSPPLSLNPHQCQELSSPPPAAILTTPTAPHSANSNASRGSGANYVSPVRHTQPPSHNSPQSGDSAVVQSNVASSPSCSSNHGDHAKGRLDISTGKCNEEHSNSISQGYNSFEHSDSNNSSTCATTEMA